MRTISIKQPWASLVAAGIKDIENRSWDPKFQGKILIHASSSKVPKSFLDRCCFEQMCVIFNEQMFGNFPKMEDLEYSAIIGYVTVTGHQNDSESIWAEPVDYQWNLADAYLFDEPIRDIKGKLNLWNYDDIDENNMPPAHKLVRRAPKLEGDTLVIPLTDEAYDIVTEGGLIPLSPTYELASLVEKEGELAEDENIFKDEIKQVRLESPSQTGTFPLEDMYYGIEKNEDGSVRQVLNRNMEETDYMELHILVGNKK